MKKKLHKISKIGNTANVNKNIIQLEIRKQTKMK